jgi:hypothetical protein
LEAYAAAVRGGDVTPAQLLAGALQYAIAKRHLDPRYIKRPANWVKEKCWLENPQPSRAQLRSAEAQRVSKPGKAQKKKTPRVSAETLHNRATEERLKSIIARDKDETIPPIGKIGNREILVGRNWRSMCVVREPFFNTTRITKMRCSDFTREPCRSIDGVLNDEVHGKIAPDVACAERNGLAAVHGWTREQLQGQVDAAKSKLDEADRAATPALVPAFSVFAPVQGATPVDDEDFG